MQFFTAANSRWTPEIRLTCHLPGDILVGVIKTVIVGKQAQKQLRKVPVRVAKKLRVWAEAVREEGLEEVRKAPGYHDEPLKGARKGQRSIRLSWSYRAIYVIRADREVEFVSVEEVGKHDY